MITSAAQNRQRLPRQIDAFVIAGRPPQNPADLLESKRALGLVLDGVPIRQHLVYELPGALVVSFELGALGEKSENPRSVGPRTEPARARVSKFRADL